MSNLEMKLSETHINFENDCRLMFVGQTIHAVFYGELKYFDDEYGNKVNPEPHYRTKYPDFDTIDHSIYLKTDNKTINIFWDNTFTCYGLKSQLLELSETTNDFEQKSDVSNSGKWISFVGKKIVEFNIVWKETWTSNLDGTNTNYTAYPQTFEIIVEDRKSIYVTASELKDSEDEYYSQMDNLLVTTNLDLLIRLETIERNQAEKYYAKKTIWTKLFG